MTHFPQSNVNQRSPRVQLHGSVAAAVMAEGGQRARAKLQTISITGGLLQLQHELSSGDFVEIAFHTRSGAIRGRPKLLNPTPKFQRPGLNLFPSTPLATNAHRNWPMPLVPPLNPVFRAPVPDSLRPPPGS